MSRYEDMTDEEKSNFDSHIGRELKVRDEEISFLKGEIEDRDKRLDVKEEEVDSHLYDIEALDKEKENLAETIRKLKDKMDDMVLRRYMIILLKGISKCFPEAIESTRIVNMREAKEYIDEVIRVHQPKDKEE